MVDDIYRKTNIEATFNSVLNHDLVAETSKKIFRLRAKTEYEEMTFLEETDLVELDVRINRNQSAINRFKNCLSSNQFQNLFVNQMNISAIAAATNSVEKVINYIEWNPPSNLKVLIHVLISFGHYLKSLKSRKIRELDFKSSSFSSVFKEISYKRYIDLKFPKIKLYHATIELIYKDLQAHFQKYVNPSINELLKNLIFYQYADSSCVSSKNNNIDKLFKNQFFFRSTAKDF